MPEIEHRLASAFVNNSSKKSKRDKITGFNVSDCAWYFHGNLIAWKKNNFIRLEDQGWRTESTKRRLNAIFKKCNIPLRIYKRNGSWYIGDNFWYGSYSFYFKEDSHEGRILNNRILDECGSHCGSIS